MNRDLQRIIELNWHSDDFYPDAALLGDHAAYAFHEQRGRRNTHRSQMTGLENIADTALKASDIFDYIKKQIARSDHWRKPDPTNKIDPRQGFGERLREYLEKDIAERTKIICEKLDIKTNDTASDEDRYQRQQTYIQLIRLFIRSMVVQYEHRMYWMTEVRDA